MMKYLLDKKENYGFVPLWKRLPDFLIMHELLLYIFQLIYGL